MTLLLKRLVATESPLTILDSRSQDQGFLSVRSALSFDPDDETRRNSRCLAW